MAAAGAGPISIAAGVGSAAPAPATSPVARTPTAVSSRRVRLGGVERFCLLALAIIGIVATIQAARDFLMPVAIAFFLALVLQPIVRTLAARGVPSLVTALGLVFATVVAFGAAVYFLAGPANELVSNSPAIARKIGDRLADLRRGLEALVRVGDQVRSAAEGLPETGEPKVVVPQPGLFSQAATFAPTILERLLLTVILLLFLLATGDLFYERTIKVMPTLHDKKIALRIMRTIQQEVASYFLSVTMINAGLGILVGVALYVLGLSSAVLYGFAVAILNFIPYVGPAVSLGLIGAGALVQFDSLGEAILPPLVFLVIVTIEGQMLTPILVGRRHQLNEVAIFLAVAFWSWIWGFAGALVAVPFLVVLKIFAEQVTPLNSLGEFLSGRSPPAEPSEKTAPGGG
ncbi:MAG: AI-2E family transporter [Bauldia sp.]